MTTDLVHSCFLVDFSLFSVYFFNIYFWYRYCLSSCLEVFYKIWFLKCLQNSLENNSGAIFFSNKVASWSAANLLKTDSSTGGFPWILRVFLRTICLERTPASGCFWYWNVIQWFLVRNIIIWSSQDIFTRYLQTTQTRKISRSDLVVLCFWKYMHLLLTSINIFPTCIYSCSTK